MDDLKVKIDAVLQTRLDEMNNIASGLISPKQAQLIVQYGLDNLNDFLNELKSIFNSHCEEGDFEAQEIENMQMIVKIAVNKFTEAAMPSPR